jgi:hypothetical protein
LKIMEYAQAIGDPNPVYRDLDAARQAGHPDVIAPPTFAVMVALPASIAAVHHQDRNPGRRRGAHLQRPGDIGQAPQCCQERPIAACAHGLKKSQNDLIRTVSRPYAA